MREKRLLIAAVGVTFLVMLVLSQVAIAPTALAKGGHKKGKISWSTNPVTATVAPGGTFSTTVTFTSTTDLNNVSIRLTPSLKGTTTVSPTTFASITAGTPYSFEIDFAAPANAHPVYNGILTLRVGHAALPQTLKLRFRVQQ
jgi:hypothetical protein